MPASVNKNHIEVIRLSDYNDRTIIFTERTGEFMEYMSAPQAAGKWGISERRVPIDQRTKRGREGHNK